MEITLPWPPSHRVWRARRGTQEYRNAVTDAIRKPLAFVGDVEVRILAHPPDTCRRHLHALAEAILDALEHVGVFADGSQVARLVIERGALWPDAEVHVTIATMETGR